MDSTMFSLNSFSRSNSLIFSFKPRVEAGVLQGNADVAGQRFEQFHVFAGEEIAADGAAQANDGDGARGGAILHAAGQVVVQVEQGGGPRWLSRRCSACWAFSRKMCEWSEAWSKSRKLEVERLLSCAWRGRSLGGQPV